jgi:peptidyl-prolyl cis-trans isomerase B (cyclophilin B)
VLSRLFSRAHRATEQHKKSIGLEGLETRVLMAVAPPNITGALADNRGEVTIQFSRSVGGLSTSTVHFFTAGPDGKIGTKDDPGQLAPITYSPSHARLIIHGVVKADHAYRIRIDANTVGDAAHRKLDGEFTGKLPTGNGVAGGNFAFYVKNDQSQTPAVRMQTSLGFIDLKMRKDVAPLTVANFLKYANLGLYDNVFFTRSENNPNPFVIQVGGLRITGKGTSAANVKVNTQLSPVADENPGGISNTIGTLSFAKNAPNNNTNQFFINLNNNSFLDSKTDPNTNGGFTVFAQITKNLTVAQAINQKPTANLQPQLAAQEAGSGAGVENAPVNNAATAMAALNPFRDLMVIARVAVIDKIKPLT